MLPNNNGASRLLNLEKDYVMSTLEKDQIQASDSLVERNRFGRLNFFLLTIAITAGGPALLLGKIFADWFNLGSIGFILGLCGGLALFFLFLYDRMIVQVEAQRAFLTLDLLKTSLNHSKAYVAYGPGFHFSYPWEQRLARNNISLVEATENFSVSVVTTTGIVTINGSYRLRPRLGTESLVAFLGGVAVVAEDVSDLIKSFVTEILAEETLDNVSKKIKVINEKLADRFGIAESVTIDSTVSTFEERFGLVIGDVTAAEVTLSAEAMKTRNAIDEGVQFAQGVAIILGYPDSAAIQKAVADKTITAQDVSDARKQFLAISDNVKMDVRDYTFNIRGLENLTPEAAKAVGAAARAYATFTATSKGAPKT